MEKIDIILWVVSGGFTLMMLMWHHLNSKIDKVEDQLNKRIDHLETRMDRFEIRMDRFEIRMDRFEARMDRLEEKINSLEKEVAIITATLKFNGFDLDRHKASGE